MCWTVVAIQLIEADIRRRGRHIQNLSPQQLVNCFKPDKMKYYPGTVRKALEWVKENGGVTTDERWPYTPSGVQCNTECVGKHQRIQVKSIFFPRFILITIDMYKMFCRLL